VLRTVSSINLCVSPSRSTRAARLRVQRAAEVDGLSSSSLLGRTRRHRLACCSDCLHGRC
jgi:hypothetical protein